MRDHLKPHDYPSTEGDLNNNPKRNEKENRDWQHKFEMKNSHESLKKSQRGFEKILKNPNLNPVLKESYKKILENINSIIEYIEELFKYYGESSYLGI